MVRHVTRRSSRQTLVKTEVAAGPRRGEVAVLRRGEVSLLEVVLVWRERLRERLRC